VLAVIRMMAEKRPHQATALGGSIEWDDEPLPFPAAVDAASLNAFLPGFKETLLEAGVRETLDRFQQTAVASR
jgi:hypothetical protein